MGSTKLSFIDSLADKILALIHLTFIQGALHRIRARYDIVSGRKPFRFFFSILQKLLASFPMIPSPRIKGE